jgi:RNA polymerase-binding transcription factor DksA
MKKDLSSLKEKLEAEKKTLISELGEIAVIKNKKNPDDWEAVPERDNGEHERSDPNDVSDRIESYENNTALVSNLDARLLEVDAALTRIELDVYGLCSVCKEPIEDKRLEANPAAMTCMKHMK